MSPPLDLLELIIISFFNPKKCMGNEKYLILDLVSDLQ